MSRTARQLRARATNPKPPRLPSCFASSWVQGNSNAYNAIMVHASAPLVFGGMTETEIRMAMLFIAEAIDNP